ncbi:DNA polymerase [Alishewanella phage vB_AspM_Slickus01]|nr:DNA polymerase [Alishewanella phage vB_AspM_Slickus01]
MERSFIDVSHDQYKGTINCWTRNEDGVLEYETHVASDYYYLFVPNNGGKTDFVNMRNQPMKKLTFDELPEMQKYAKNFSGVHESDVHIEYKFILDNFMNSSTECPVNIGFYDIEVDFDLDEGKGYPSIRDPFGAINAISLFDDNRKTFVMLMLTGTNIELTDSEFPIESHTFLCEKQLLQYFCKKVIKDIDLLTGWNVIEFDLNYIMERLILLFGSKRAASMLCRNEHNARKIEYVNENGEEIWRWELVGRKHLDMMQVYKKFKPKSLESFSLSSVCMFELNEDKQEYDGDLGELYRENPQKFFEYSLHDSRLLFKLNKKLNLMAIVVLFTRESCVFMDDVTGTVKPIEHAFLRFCRQEGNIVLPDKKHHDKEEFRGAVVYDTLCGLHKWLFSIDLTGLYPSIMIMLGLSSENLMMQLCENDLDYYRVLERQNVDVKFVWEETGEVLVMKAYEIDDLIRENGYVMSAAGTVFNGEMGLLARFVKNGFDQRSKFKLMMKDAKTKESFERYNLLQNSKKLANNSLYGCISNSYFRLFDIRMARSITYSGAIVSKFMTYKTNETLKEVIR